MLSLIIVNIIVIISINICIIIWHHGVFQCVEKMNYSRSLHDPHHHHNKHQRQQLRTHNIPIAHIMLLPLLVRWRWWWQDEKISEEEKEQQLACSYRILRSYILPYSISELHVLFYFYGSKNVVGTLPSSLETYDNITF